MKSSIAVLMLFIGMLFNSHWLSAQSPHQFSVHVGYGSGLDGGGVNGSLYYAYKPERMFHFEGQLFLDHVKGGGFLSSKDVNFIVTGLTAGGRWNMIPNNVKWNPSIYLMPGIGISTDDYENEPKFVVSAGFTNTINRKHIITLGSQLSHYAVLLKYGFVF